MSLPVMVRISNKLLVSLDYLVFGKTARDNRDNKEHEKTCICVEARDIYKEINFILERCSATHGIQINTGDNKHHGSKYGGSVL